MSSAAHGKEPPVCDKISLFSRYSALSAMTNTTMDADGIFDFPSPVNHLLSRLYKVRANKELYFDYIAVMGL